MQDIATIKLIRVYRWVFFTPQWQMELNANGFQHKSITMSYTTSPI